jgi:hypothetical protein
MNDPIPTTIKTFSEARHALWQLARKTVGRYFCHVNVLATSQLHLSADCPGSQVCMLTHKREARYLITDVGSAPVNWSESDLKTGEEVIALAQRYRDLAAFA